MISLRETIITRKGDSRYIGDITKTLDNNMIYVSERFYNYVYGELAPNVYVFRKPGSTTGKIVVDDKMIIREIKVYSDSMVFYSSDVNEELKQYIGMKLIIEED